MYNITKNNILYIINIINNNKNENKNINKNLFLKITKIKLNILK